ncbi:MAG: HEAT repeat domain-containing protein [Planctomycetota bacterium]|nr:HEAT repeat domain-containing protein [Planctomycetota bacterium]
MRVVLAIILSWTVASVASPSEELQTAIENYESSKNLRINNRIPTILAFGRLQENGAAQFLQKVFREEILPEAKEAALQGMVKMETEVAAHMLIQIGSERQFDGLIVEGLGGCSAPEVRDVVYDRARGKGASSIDDRLVALEVISLYKDGRAEEALLGSLKDRHTPIRVSAATGLAGFEGKATLEALENLLSDRDRQVQIQAMTSLSKRKDPLSKKTIMGALRKKVWEVRAGALGALRDRTDDWVFDATVDALHGDRAWQVRAQAVVVLRSIRQKRCIPPLIKSLGKENGRLKDDVHRALVDLTRMKMDSYLDDWQGWWKDNEDTFEVPDRKGEFADGTPTRRRGKDDQATFFKRVVHSRKMIFLIDLSQSMKEEYVPLGTTGTQQPGSEEKERKIDVAKKELIGLIEQLKPNTNFNIFFFTAFPQPWKESLQKATPKNRELAIKFVEKAQPAGVTNIYDTLERALGDKDVDTIYLLTDGIPTAGKHKHPRLNEFKIAVNELNQHRRVKINTISFGHQKQSYRWFLEALSEDNFGEYIAR